LNISDHEKQVLIETAKKSISSFKNKAIYSLPDKSSLPSNLLISTGAFVSIYIDNKLRGCIGRIHTQKTSLIQIVSEMAVYAAFNDHRFAPINDDEFDRIIIEISVLTPLQKINSIHEIVLGKHGIYIKKDSRSGTFLPQVADKTNWTVEEFVANCSKNKAGLGWDGWKNAELYVYEAIVFGG
jgi:MEMO1 family protein